MSHRILVVEDDATLRLGLHDTLVHEGHAVHSVPDGEAAQAALVAQAFDLVVLDLMIPKRSGLLVLRELRARGDTTLVLVLTAKGDESDKVLGLELGADDYVTKPFGLRELLARVKALLRRTQPRDFAPRTLVLGEVTVDLDAFTWKRGAVSETLSPKEAAMLDLLWQERGKAVSRERFLREVWNGGLHVGDRTIDTHMLNLRTKLEADPKNPRHLLTVHGVGYRLDLEP